MLLVTNITFNNIFVSAWPFFIIKLKKEIYYTLRIKTNVKKNCYILTLNIKNTIRLIIEKLIHIIDTNNSNHSNKINVKI